MGPFQRLVCVALAGGLLLSPASARDRRERDGEEQRRPRLKLRADVQAGFAPLSIVFTGRLQNVDLEDDTFCHAGTFLVRKLAEGELQILAGEDAKCLHSPEEQYVSPTFSHTYVIHDEGRYEFYAMVKTKDGRSILSNGVPVRVLSSPAGG